MDSSMKLYWSLYFENISTQKLIEGNCLIKSYKHDLIQGPIIDIGCGQSKELLAFIKSDRQIFAVDSEQLQLDYLEKRVLEKKNSVDNWNFFNLNIGVDEIPLEKYALIVCSNLLHFFSIESCISLVKSWYKNIVQGTLIYVEVHSEKHPSNNPNNPDNNEYFKHYFSERDLDILFPSDKFEILYFSDTQKTQTAEENAILNLWLDKWYEINKITDKREIEEDKAEYLKNNRQANFSVIYKCKK
jgi:hypothetical protein